MIGEHTRRRKPVACAALERTRTLEVRSDNVSQSIARAPNKPGSSDDDSADRDDDDKREDDDEDNELGGNDGNAGEDEKPSPDDGENCAKTGVGCGTADDEDGNEESRGRSLRDAADEELGGGEPGECEN